MHAYLTHKLYNNVNTLPPPLRVALSIICRCSGWLVRWSRLGLLGQTNSALHSSNNCQVRETLLSCLVPLSCSVIIHYYAILLQREAQTVEISTLLRLSCTSSLTTGGWDYFCSLPLTLTTMVRLLQQQADKVTKVSLVAGSFSCVGRGTEPQYKTILHYMRCRLMSLTSFPLLLVVPLSLFLQVPPKLYTIIFDLVATKCRILGFLL